MELPRLHKNLFFSLPAPAFLQAAADLDSTLGIRNDTEIIVAFARLLAMVKDAHTQLQLQPGVSGFHAYPLQLAWFADGLYVLGTTAAYTSALGKRVVGIGTSSLAYAYTQVSTLISRENDEWLLSRTPHYLVLAEVLSALHLLRNADRGLFVLAENDTTTSQLALLPQPLPDQSDWFYVGSTVRLRDQQAEKPFWFTYMTESHMLYFKYNACINADAFQTFAQSLFDCIDHQHVTSLVIDLRDNYGGNSSQFAPILQGLDKRPNINQPGRLFTLISHNTSSSASINAYELHKRTNTTLIGTPTGSNLSRYGEVRALQLPHSQLIISYSTKYFRLDNDNNGPLSPDIQVQTSFSDYLAGRDPALEMAQDIAAKS